MADKSTVISFRGDISDLDKKLQSIKSSADATFSELTSALTKTKEAQDKLDTATEHHKLTLKATKDEIGKLNAEKAKNGYLSKEQELRLESLNSELKQQEQAHKKIETALKKEVIAAKRLVSTLRVSYNTYNQLTTGILKQKNASETNVKSMKKEDAERRALMNGIVRHIRRLESLAVAYFAVTNAYKNTFGAGVQLNREYENMELGISALIAAKTKMVDSNGKEVDSYTKFLTAQQQTSEVLDEIKKQATDTPATFSQMIGFYQQAIGHALAAGNSFGTSINEINTNVITLTKRMSSLGSSVGMSMDLINEEIRSLMSGGVTSDSKLALILFGSPTAANEAIKEAKKSAGGLTKLFNEKLIPFAVLENIETFDKNLNKLVAEIQTLQKEASKPVFDDISSSFKTLTSVLKERGDGISDTFHDIYSNVKLLAIPFGTLNNTIDMTLDALFDANKEFDNTTGISKYTAGLVTLSTILDTVYVGFYNTFQLLKRIPSPSGNAFVDVYNVYKSFSEDYTQLIEKDLMSYDDLKKRIDNNIDDILDARTTLTNLKSKDIGIGGFSITEDMNEIDSAEIFKALERQNAEYQSKYEGNEFALSKIKRKYLSERDDLLKQYAIRGVKILIKAKEEEEEIDQKFLDRKLDISRRSELLGLDDETKAKRKLYHSYLDDLENFKDTQDYKLILTREYNEKYDKLTEQYAKKDDKKEESEIEKKEKLFALDMKFRKAQLDLIDDEHDRAIALAYLNQEEANKELEFQLEKKDASKEYYDKSIALQQKLTDKIVEGHTLMGQALKVIADEMEKDFTAFFDYADERFLQFGELGKQVLHEIYIETLKSQVTKPIASAFTSGNMWENIGATIGDWMGFAKGGAISSPSLSQYSNQVVSQPTPFFFANGGVPNLGVFGEAGSEAIMPLTRTSSGDLGVRSVGGGGNIVLNIENNTSTPIEAEMISEMLKKDERGEEQRVVNIVLKNIQTNSAFRSALRG